MVVIFNLQNSHSLTLSLPTEEVFQVNGQSRPVANPPVVDFHSQPREMITFGFSFIFYYIGFLPLLEFEPLCLSAIRNFKCFSRHNSRKLRQTTCIENRENFAVHSSTWPSGAKGGWRVSSWLAISTHVKNTIFFHVCCYSFSQGQKSLYNTALYLIITFIK